MFLVAEKRDDQRFENSPITGEGIADRRSAIGEAEAAVFLLLNSQA